MATPSPTPPAPPASAWGPWRWSRFAAFAAAYVALGELGDWLTTQQNDFSTFWPASGLFVAALLLSDLRDWKWLALIGAAADVAVSAHVGRAPLMAAVNAAGDVAEAVAGALLVRRFVAARPTAGTVREVLGLLVLAAGVAAAVSATPGAAMIWAKYRDRPYWAAWLDWSIGDALGVLVVAPLLLSWTGPQPSPPRFTRRRWVEAAALLAALAAGTWLVLGAEGRVTLERQYLLLPCLLWAALRFGVRGASASAGVLAGGSAWAAAKGYIQPFAVMPALQGLPVQAFLAVTIGTVLLLAAALAERERAEAALAESEGQFALFLHHSPALVFVRDAAGRAVALSRHFEKVAGRPVRELLGRSSAAFLPPDEAERIRLEDEEVLEGGRPREFTTKLAGRTFFTVKFPIPRDGKRALLGGISLDLTDLRRAEHALLLAQFALDHASDGVLFLDPSGRVTYANESARRLLGRPMREVLAQPIWELDGTFDAAGWPARWAEIGARGSLVRESTLPGLAGPRVQVEVSLSRLTYDGQAYCLYAARDISDRRRAEEALRMASLGTLSAGIAHEINNPLTYVSGNLSFAADALSRRAGDPELEEALVAIQEASEGARRVGRIVRDLKTVSRSERRNRVPVDLHAEIQAALAFAQHEIRHRARLVTRLEPVPRVEAAEGQLGQVFLNLLVNAAHAIPDGQAQSHEIGVATFTGADGGAVVEITDSGSGISAAVRPRIFEPFFTTKPVGGGTGLGLAICHGIVGGLGGTIEVESEEGKGSLFRVRLPAAPDPSRAAEAGPAATAPTPRGRILVVDDEALVGRSVRRILGGEHDVDCLTDPRKALARIEAGERFDVVFCDLMMPEMSGMEFHERVARLAPDVARRVVVITGGAFTDGAREFLARTSLPSLEKPLDPAALRDLVRARVAGG